MPVITEDSLRIKYFRQELNESTLKLPKGTILTPSAKSYLKEKKKSVEFVQDDMVNNTDENKTPHKQGDMSLMNDQVDVGHIDEKPDYMATLQSRVSSKEDHEQAILRGKGGVRLNQSYTDVIKQTINKVMLEESLVVAEASGRHVHLSREAIDYLFGEGYHLTKAKELSQPGQFACEERLTIKGSKGEIDNVVILGPERSSSQVEVSLTDAVVLGEKAPVRQSGDITGTPGITIVHNGRELRLDQGLIAAKRHIHVSTEDADKLNVQNNEIVQVKVFGERSLVFDEVVIRVSSKYVTAMHIDFDEANACGFKKGMLAKIIKKDADTEQSKADHGQPLQNHQRTENATVSNESVRLSKKVVTETDVQKTVMQKSLHMVIPENSIVTPLASDYIRRHKLTLQRSQESTL